MPPIDLERVQGCNTIRSHRKYRWLFLSGERSLSGPVPIRRHIIYPSFRGTQNANNPQNLPQPLLLEPLTKASLRKTIDFPCGNGPNSAETSLCPRDLNIFPREIV